MNAAESLAIVRYVRSVCPQQKFDEYTPDAWARLLARLDFADAQTAVDALALRGPFISPAEIHSEVRRIRAERVRAVPGELLEPEGVDPDDVNAWVEAKRARIEAIASGRFTPEPLPEGPKRPIAELLASAAERHALPENLGESA